MSSPSTQSSRGDVSYYIHVVIMLFWMFGFQFIPPIEPLTELGMQALGIFIGLIWAWTFIDFIWPSLLGFVAVGLSGFMTIDQAFTSGFGNTTTIMIAAVFAFAAYMTSTGICETVSYWFVTRKICVGKPYVFLFLFTLSAFVLSATVGLIAAYVIGWAIAYAVSESLGYKKGDPFPAVMVVSSTFGAMLGATTFPFRPFAVMAINNSKNIAGMDCSFIDWIVPSLSASLSALVAYILAMKFIVRADTSKFIAGGDVFDEFRKKINLTNEQKIAAVVMLVVILVACVPGFLPAGNPVKAFLSKFTLGPLIAISIAVLYAIHKDGQPLTDYVAHLKNGMDWNTIIMVASSMPVASMIQSADSGVTVLLNQLLTSLLGGLGPVGIAVVFVIFAGLVTQIAHNLVLMIVLAPIVCNVSLVLNFNPIPVLIMLAFACNTGIGTAGASVMGAMLFANREWVPTGLCFKYTWIGIVICILCMCVIGVPVAMLMDVGTPLVM